MSKVKLAVVGLGRMGREHASNIKYQIPEAELVAVCSVVPEELKSVVDELHVPYGAMDFAEMVKETELDGVVIATNSQSHCDLICQAAELGVKNIYTEKPVGMTLEELETIKEAVQKNQVNILQVGYNRRFDKNYQRMKEKIDEGAVGKPVLVKMINRDNTWDAKQLEKFAPSSGGFIFDMCTHDFDAARWFLNSEYKSVYAAGDVYKFEGIRGIDIDNVALIVEFENGALGVFEASRNSAMGYHMETEVFGTEGSIRVNSAPYEDRLIVMDKDGAHQRGFGWYYAYWRETYVNEIRHFVECIKENKQPSVGLIDGIKTVEWAYAANQSLDKKAVIFADEFNA